MKPVIPYSGTTAFIVWSGGILTAKNAADSIVALGLGTIATQDANSVNIDGGAIDGTPIGANSASTIVATTLGVGIAAPGAKLHVYGSSAGAIENDANAVIIVEKGTSPLIQIQGGTTQQVAGIIIGDADDHDAGRLYYNIALDQWEFYSTGTLCLTLDENGLQPATPLKHEYGGLEDDVSAYDGLVKVSGGNTSQVTDNSSNWDTAYGWGDHSGLYELTGAVSTHSSDTTSVHGIADTSALLDSSDIGTAVLAPDGDGSGLSGVVTAETDPIVGAVTGIVKADGGGNISAAVAGTDYLTSVAVADLSDGTVTAAEVNLLDLAGLTTGDVLRATGATTAAWGAIDISTDLSPQLGGDLDANGNSIHFGTAENTQTPAGTTATIDLGAENHHTLNCGSATGTVELTLTVPSGPTAGTIIIIQDDAAKDITWSPSSGSARWLGTEPTWADDDDMIRVISWRWDASNLYLTASDTYDNS
jgi:hypothetical protein